MKTSSNETLVDIILPNYNKSKFIEDAINSVISQTYKNWHLYIIDDSSTDNSHEVINKFSNWKSNDTATDEIVEMVYTYYIICI